MKLFYISLAFIAGAVLPIQVALNAKMGKAVHDPVYAAFISFVVGSIALFIYLLLTRVELNQITNASSVHWSVWLGGVLGGFYVAAVIVLLPQIGLALTFGLVVAGQLILSLFLDHFGLMGVPVHHINWQRIVGIVLIITGVVIIRKY